ncbi:unnamed protein product [Haemonchus placei]|uniref:DIOX_N domain-containing protein n=1 Tax=Haemonchus placei TaxID=6290 RepID=A0A0N4W0L2_HAEPC|nr:unnamed protein product [Haemonchus placei]
MESVLQSQSPGLELSIGEITVASAVASEKARMRQQSAMLDKWLMANGGNLYPCREDKEKLAAQMKMTYLQFDFADIPVESKHLPAQACGEKSGPKHVLRNIFYSEEFACYYLS